jgi:hypothetical protein
MMMLMLLLLLLAPSCCESKQFPVCVVGCKPMRCLRTRRGSDLFLVLLLLRIPPAFKRMNVDGIRMHDLAQCFHVIDDQTTLLMLGVIDH